MGQAIAYVLNQWDALAVYVTDGNLAIDNNAAENALRRIAIGRKNWLFCGSDNGGHTAAVLFSLIATCQRHEVDPFTYLRDVLTRIAAHPINRLGDLLPNRWKPDILPSYGTGPHSPSSPTPCPHCRIIMPSRPEERGSDQASHPNETQTQSRWTVSAMQVPKKAHHLGGLRNLASMGNQHGDIARN